MVALKDILRITVGPRPEKHLCDMSDLELEAIISKNSKIMAARSGFQGSPEYREAHKNYADAHRVLDTRHGEYL